MIIDLEMTQAALVLQMARAWDVHLQTVIAKAKKQGHDIAVQNAEIDRAMVAAIINKVKAQPVEAEVIAEPLAFPGRGKSKWQT